MQDRKKQTARTPGYRQRLFLFGKELAKRNVLRAMRIISSHPGLKAGALRVLNHHPVLKNRLKAWAAARYHADLGAKSRLISRNILGAWPPEPNAAFLDALNNGSGKPADITSAQREVIKQTYYQELQMQRRRLHASELNK